MTGSLEWLATSERLATRELVKFSYITLVVLSAAVLFVTHITQPLELVTGHCKNASCIISYIGKDQEYSNSLQLQYCTKMLIWGGWQRDILDCIYIEQNIIFTSKLTKYCGILVLFNIEEKTNKHYFHANMLRLFHKNDRDSIVLNTSDWQVISTMVLKWFRLLVSFLTIENKVIWGSPQLISSFHGLPESVISLLTP